MVAEIKAIIASLTTKSEWFLLRLSTILHVLDRLSCRIVGDCLSSSWSWERSAMIWERGRNVIHHSLGLWQGIDVAVEFLKLVRSGSDIRWRSSSHDELLWGCIEVWVSVRGPKSAINQSIIFQSIPRARNPHKKGRNQRHTAENPWS